MQSLDPAAKARAKTQYMLHPMCRAQIAALKIKYEARQRNSETPYSLEEFYASLDAAEKGQLRLEDFRAGWGAGGVKLAPDNMLMMRGAYGEPYRHIKYPDTLNDLAGLEHTRATNTMMTTLMGKATAKYCGYANMDEPEDVPITYDTRSDLKPGTKRPSSTMGMSRTATLGSTKASSQYPKPRSAAASMTATRLSTGNTSVLQASFEEFDPQNTGSVTLEGFLCACARAGVSMPPDELNALRVAGTLKRPFKKSPELVNYAVLTHLMGQTL